MSLASILKLSRPARARGLKPDVAAHLWDDLYVAPLTGAWVETAMGCRNPLVRCVAPEIGRVLLVVVWCGKGFLCHSLCFGAIGGAPLATLRGVSCNQWRRRHRSRDMCRVLEGRLSLSRFYRSLDLLDFVNLGCKDGGFDEIVKYLLYLCGVIQ